MVDAKRVCMKAQRNVLPRNSAFDGVERAGTRLGCVTELLPRTSFLELHHRPIREEAHAPIADARLQLAAGFAPPNGRDVTIQLARDPPPGEPVEGIHPIL